MDSKDIVIEGLGRIQTILTKALESLTPEQLTYRPHEQANSIAWLAWHLTRVQDNHLSSLAGREQAWVADGWHAKFGKPADARDNGHGDTPEQVAGFKPASAQLLLDYHNAVYARSVELVQQLSAADMDKPVDDPRYNPPPLVGVRLVSVLADNLQHAGQINYVRGLIEQRHWLGV